MGPEYSGPPPELIALAIPLLFIIVAGLVAVTLIISLSARGAVQHAQTERTRRELAAYVAEGSITPDDAERLLVATPETRRHACGHHRGPRRGRHEQRRPVRPVPEGWS